MLVGAARRARAAPRRARRELLTKALVLCLCCFLLVCSLFLLHCLLVTDFWVLLCNIQRYYW